MKKIITNLLLVLSALVVFCFASTANAAINFDASSTNGGAIASTTASTTITVGSGSNELLLIFLQNANTATATSITVNGVPATLAVQKINASRDSEIWYATSTASGVANVSTTVSKSGTHIVETLASFFGISQINPFLSESSSTSGSVTLNASSGYLVVEGNGSTGSGPTSTVNAAQIAFSTTTLNSNIFGVSSYLIATTTASYTVGWNDPGNNVEAGAVFGSAIIPPTSDVTISSGVTIGKNGGVTIK